MALFGFRRSRDDDKAEMSFVDHLEVLRGHLFRSVIAIAIGALAIGIFNKFFVHYILMGPTHNDFPTYKVMCKLGRAIHLERALCMSAVEVKMQSTSVAGQFTTFFSVILIGGFIIAFPYVFWQFWKFVKPALTKKELQKTRGVIFWVSLLFFTGVLFGYFVITPYAINFFAKFQLDKNIENRWTIGSYFDIMTPLILGSGLTFQLPLAMFFLAKIGIVSATILRKVRKYAIVIIFIVAAFITPGPDVISQVIVAVPLLLLYEISIWLTASVEKEKKKEEAEWS
jgi:sec-independent protein translocase protein TatC